MPAPSETYRHFVPDARPSRDDFLVRNELLESLVVHYEFSILDFTFHPIHSSRRGSPQKLPLRRELPVVAGTDELVLVVVPGDRASQVGANRRQRAKMPIRVSEDIHRFLRDDLAPAISLLDLYELLYRRSYGSKILDGSDFLPCRLSFGLDQRMKQEAQKRPREKRTDTRRPSAQRTPENR